ncbi:MAG TPA: hypothetical protein VI603_03390 [Saprospiraceae bacterium]|nr:hypothetical protein [Saprospiraceae bacterium]
MKSVYAFTMLLVMSMQWLAGSMYLKATYLVEIKPEMTTTEKAIANIVLDEFGFLTHVKVIDDVDREFINGMGYAAPFVHSLELDGTVNSFTVATSGFEFQNVEVTVNRFDDMQHQHKNKASVERLFSQFCFGQHTRTQNVIQLVITRNNFSVISLHDIFDQADPSPPPRLV